MANNYLSFSVGLPRPAGETEEVDRKIELWVEKEREAREDLEDSEDAPEYGDGPYDGIMLSVLDIIRPDRTSGYQKEVWVRGDDGGGIDNAVNLIQRYLEDLGIEGGVYVSWSETCSKPRYNEFAGGAAVITKDAVLWIHSLDIQKTAEEQGIKILNP